MGTGKKPEGWHGNAAKQARREAREKTRAEHEADRVLRDRIAAETAKSTEPIRRHAAKRLASLPAHSGKLAAVKREQARSRQAAAEKRRDALVAKWRPWEGTPETNERIASTPSHRREWPLDRMARLGTIDADELAAAEEIAQVIEAIERSVSVRSGSLEARVDCSGSARDALVESLGRIRLEVTYREWREKIPVPRRMILDMLTTNVPYNRLAKRHRLHWRTARKRLISALRLWISLRADARRVVDREAVEDAYARLGEGVLVVPRPKAQMPTIAEDEAA